MGNPQSSGSPDPDEEIMSREIIRLVHRRLDHRDGRAIGTVPFSLIPVLISPNIEKGVMSHSSISRSATAQSSRPEAAQRAYDGAASADLRDPAPGGTRGRLARLVRAVGWLLFLFLP